MDMGNSARAAAAEGERNRRLGKTRLGLGFGGIVSVIVLNPVSDGSFGHHCILRQA
jgi:hypothetical protein